MSSPSFGGKAKLGKKREMFWFFDPDIKLSSYNQDELEAYGDKLKPGRLQYGADKHKHKGDTF